jgi:hypothetical protein
MGGENKNPQNADISFPPRNEKSLPKEANPAHDAPPRERHQPASGASECVFGAHDPVR